MTQPSRPDIVEANIAVYEDLHESFNAGRNTYLPVMRDEMTSFIGYLEECGAKSVLDVGSGAGIHAQVCAEAGFEVTCVDAALNMLRIVKANVPGAICQHADFWTYEPHRKFDGVILASFIHLFPKEDLPKVIERVNSWMNPGAVAWIATVPGEPHDGAWLEKEENHGKAKRWRVVYGRDELLNKLVSLGLTIIETLQSQPDGIHADKEWLDVICMFPGSA